MSNIILVGMPACGKSTIGVVLAKTINKGFVDTDILIQEQENNKLQDIINQKGNAYFHKVEESVLKSLDKTNSVIATGGSAIYFPEAIAHLKQNGIVIYIKVSKTTILDRLDNIKTRGVTLKQGQTLEDLYNVRVPLYEKYADIIIEAEKLRVEEVIEKIIEKIKDLEKNN